MISEGRYRQLNIELSRAGYRSVEPVAIAEEHPGLIDRVVQQRLNEGESVAELARDAFLVQDEFEDLYVRSAA